MWLSFIANQSSLLNMEMDKSSFNEEVILGTVQIFGLRPVTTVFLNSNEIGFSFNLSTSVSVSLNNDEYLNNNESKTA